MNRNNNAVPAQIKQHELFVGNLSYFFTEDDLYNLFSNFGGVYTLRIKRNDKGTRSLQFGFVCMNALEEAEAARRALDGVMIMGRVMKVEFSQSEKPRNPGADQVGIQLHIQFYAEFPPNAIVKPTEEFLRRVYERFGPILDVTVKEYHEKPYKQDGYGFISYATEEGAVNAANQASVVVVCGIKLTSGLSRSSNQFDRPPPVHSMPQSSSFHQKRSFQPSIPASSSLNEGLRLNSFTPPPSSAQNRLHLAPQQRAAPLASRFQPQPSDILGLLGNSSSRSIGNFSSDAQFQTSSFLGNEPNNMWGATFNNGSNSQTSTQQNHFHTLPSLSFSSTSPSSIFPVYNDHDNITNSFHSSPNTSNNSNNSSTSNTASNSNTSNNNSRLLFDRFAPFH